MFIIRRQGWLAYERAVAVYACQRNPTPHWLNPVTEVEKATGFRLSRGNCVVSFADGLVVAGHEVLIEYRSTFDRQGMTQRADATVRHTLRSLTTDAYFLLGFAWGKKAWPALVESLQKYVVPAKRLDVFLHTARYYCTGNACHGPGVPLILP